MQATDISHRFGDRVALDGVTLTVPAGTVVGLLGPNGAGKSTFMRILFGVLDPDGGEVRWDGRVATAADRREWGYMPQERGLYRDMRVLDHLVWLARLHGVERDAATEAATNLLTRLGIDDRAGDEVKNLSGGMAQRVQLAAAMVHDPPVLVLDEPFAGLDPTAVGFLSEVVLAHAAAGGRVLFSSHQLDLVEDLCETITMIDDGRVVLVPARSCSARSWASDSSRSPAWRPSSSPSSARASWAGRFRPRRCPRSGCRSSGSCSGSRSGRRSPAWADRWSSARRRSAPPCNR